MILGLASSGVHSNGYSLVRRIVERAGIGYSDPAPFDADRSLGEALLDADPHLREAAARRLRRDRAASRRSPTSPAAASWRTSRASCPTRSRADIDLVAVPVPPVFGWLAQTGGVAEAEMLRTFNCGIGMIVVVADADAAAVERALQSAGETVVPLGRIGRTPGRRR